MKKQMGLYVHVPFCSSKCYYCDFLSANNLQMADSYVETLLSELKFYATQIQTEITTIFIGGGTPTVLPPLLLHKIVDCIQTNFKLSQNLEWSIEANPATITPEHLKIIQNSKINRVSIGLQSTHNHLLTKLGRIHTFNDWENTIASLVDIGIKHINTDVMFALPDQTIDEWEETLQTIVSYNIDHVSAYALIVEDGTPFATQKLNLPTDEQDREMYEIAKSVLRQNGFMQYEISNWAKPNGECRHNILYWTLEPYIGAGLGASGYLNKVRYTNTPNLKQYISGQNIIEEKTQITQQMSIEEFLFLGLRMTQGVSKREFYNKFGQHIDTQLAKCNIDGVFVQNGDKVALSDYGINISNKVFSMFI
ncbi:MAG: hypothetical protein ATN35_05000 [Epulopiscium sp. Nele67-Bin004]|nr:MAG: hypothetical protein ATN35_05000 [Epulopiscium sp. Nele67-Bin004]